MEPRARSPATITLSTLPGSGVPSTMTSAQRGFSITPGGASRRQPLRQCRASRPCMSSSGEITPVAYLIVRSARGMVPAMTKTCLFAGLLVLTAAGVAHGGGQSGTIGVGAEAQISGVGGASINYDAGDFHVGGFLGFHDPGGRNDDELLIGGRFFYHLHSTAMSDFGLGGTLGIASQNNPAPVDRQTLLFIEPGFQIRLFLAMPSV